MLSPAHKRTEGLLKTGSRGCVSERRARIPIYFWSQSTKMSSETSAARTSRRQRCLHPQYESGSSGDDANATCLQPATSERGFILKQLAALIGCVPTLGIFYRDDQPV